MDFKAKKVVFFTCVGILLFHFAMLGFYALPDGWKNPYLNSLNRWYVLPQFHHNFVVFAPDPPLSNQHFVFRFQKQDGQWTSWQEVGTEWLQQGRANPFSSHYKRWKIQHLAGLRLQQLYSSYLENPQIQHLGEASVQKMAKEAIVRSEAYQNANRFALKYGEYDSVRAVQVGFISIPLEEAKNEEPLLRVAFPPYKRPQ